MTAVRTIPTEQDILGWYASLSNWGRWGGDDERGTLNLITPAKRLQAIGLVREGLVISCARTIGYDAAADIAKEAAKTGRTIREVAREKTSLSEDELKHLLDATKMTAPGLDAGPSSS